ncbi:hypothetical protein F5B18DRAFT_639815 [Nemania serpens]|nr:hypothetical protein F5B18DRAFT_639815 [Nemania serpens]
MAPSRVCACTCPRSSAWALPLRCTRNFVVVLFCPVLHCSALFWPFLFCSVLRCSRSWFSYFGKQGKEVSASLTFTIFGFGGGWGRAGFSSFTLPTIARS